MNKYRLAFYAGIGEDKNGQAIQDLPAKLETIRCYLASVFGGYTEQAASGGWYDGEGRLVKEPSVVFSAVTMGPKGSGSIASQGHKAAQFIATQLNQSAVLFTRQHLLQMSFVEQEQENETA